jgi:hypothetical protein
MRVTLLGMGLLIATNLGATGAEAQGLAEITRRIDARRMRASSGLFDPESNLDALEIPAGATVAFAELEGAGEIRHIWLTVGSADRRYSRSLVLRMYWDGAEAPSVETPIGDFFAAGNGMRATVTSDPIEVTSYGRAFNSYWRMPFRRSARLTVTNESTEPVTSLYFYVDWLQFDRLPADAMYFHARYKQEFPVPEFTPYTLADIRGTGHYVGTILSIQSSMASWLGEADDRFFIDGEELPSMVGTGLEDYFTDAWNLRLFSNPRAGVTVYEPKGPDQRATMYRWHIDDPIPFSSSLRIEFERRSYATVVNPTTGAEENYDFKYRPDFFSSVAFWYATEPAQRFWPFPPVSERVNPEIFVETAVDPDGLVVSPGVTAESRYTRATNVSGGPASREMVVLGAPGPGATVDVPFTVDTAGIYAISVNQILLAEAGIWSVRLRGERVDTLLHPGLDFYDRYLTFRPNAPENVLYGTFNESKMGQVELPAGAYVMRFESVGANPLSRRSGVRDTRRGHRRVYPAEAGEVAYDMALDGISLRRLPWERTWAWMEDYLARERTLFAEREATAAATVRRLADAVERFRRERGHLPGSLEELVGRYLEGDRIPLDPWRQRYRYDAPGTHSDEGFDVYSVHGNERAPEGWIGNWQHPR